MDKQKEIDEKNAYYEEMQRKETDQKNNDKMLLDKVLVPLPVKKPAVQKETKNTTQKNNEVDNEYKKQDEVLK